MLYKQFKDDNISLLGFGCMRFPLIEGTTTVDEALTEKMVDYAIEHGVNYFDTAAPYHNGTSETVIGKILKKYPRESFYLATKYPGHQIKPGTEDETTTPEAVFEAQLKKCQVEYFDYYLLHNVCENSYGVYTSKERKILDYFVEQKKQGKIRHLGFSSHGKLDNLKDFVERYGEHLEFCQIQLNYLDWTLQGAKEKYEYLAEKGIGIWVMESVRGGILANLRDEFKEKMNAARPGDSCASWALRWMQSLPHVNVALSGMSSFEQVTDNIKTYEEIKPLTESEFAILDDVVKGFANFVPCTGCGYCLKECPQELPIPGIIATYNDMMVRAGAIPGMYIEALPEEKRPSACLACRACEAQCPQKIEISAVMEKCAKEYASKPTWTQVCKERYDIAH